MFKCPRCHRGKLFSGFVTVAPVCSECGLELARHEQGDGPAYFGILIMGTLAALGAAIVEVKYAPSFWVHAALWLPFIILGSLVCLRVGKAMLIGVQYQLNPDDFR